LSKKEKKVKKRNPKGSKFFRTFRVLFSWVVGLIFRIKVVNRQNEPAEGGYVVCANHISATDPIMLCYAFRKHQVRFMAKKELFSIPVLAQLIRMLGAFPVDRGGGDVGAIKNAVGIVEGGCCLGIFPQGHRYPGEDPRGTPTKNGAALIAVRASAPVVPVYIWRKGKKGGVFRRTYVIIGEKIPFESFGYDKEATGEYNRITAAVFDRVCALGEEFEASLGEKKKR
jgi:1-acyl-sn-glycerol-3-phosphate acyltransferase